MYSPHSKTEIPSLLVSIKISGNELRVQTPRYRFMLSYSKVSWPSCAEHANHIVMLRNTIKGTDVSNAAYKMGFTLDIIEFDTTVSTVPALVDMKSDTH